MSDTNISNGSDAGEGTGTGTDSDQEENYCIGHDTQVMISLRNALGKTPIDEESAKATILKNPKFTKQKRFGLNKSLSLLSYAYEKGASDDFLFFLIENGANVNENIANTGKTLLDVFIDGGKIITTPPPPIGSPFETLSSPLNEKGIKKLLEIGANPTLEASQNTKHIINDLPINSLYRARLKKIGIIFSADYNNNTSANKSVLYIEAAYGFYYEKGDSVHNGKGSIKKAFESEEEINRLAKLWLEKEEEYTKYKASMRTQPPQDEETQVSDSTNLIDPIELAKEGYEATQKEMHVSSATLAIEFGNIERFL